GGRHEGHRHRLATRRRLARLRDGRDSAGARPFDPRARARGGARARLRARVGRRVVHAHSRIRAGRARGPRTAAGVVSRWLRVGAAAAFGVAVLSAAGAAVVLTLVGRDPGPSAQGELAVAGLTARARIVRDPFGIPHVAAENWADAYRA